MRISQDEYLVHIDREEGEAIDWPTQRVSDVVNDAAVPLLRSVWRSVEHTNTIPRTTDFTKRTVMGFDKCFCLRLVCECWVEDIGPGDKLSV